MSVPLPAGPQASSNAARATAGLGRCPQSAGWLHPLGEPCPHVLRFIIHVSHLSLTLPGPEKGVRSKTQALQSVGCSPTRHPSGHSARVWQRLLLGSAAWPLVTVTGWQGAPSPGRFRGDSWVAIRPLRTGAIARRHVCVGPAPCVCCLLWTGQDLCGTPVPGQSLSGDPDEAEPSPRC